MSENKYRRYVIFLNKIKGIETSESLIREHVRFLRKIDEKGKLDLCGPFLDHEGGMLIVKVDSFVEAQNLAKSDPFVSSGARSFEIRTWELSCEENNHLGMG